MNIARRSIPLRGPHRVAGDGGQRAALPGADLQHAPQGLLVQRDSQQEGGARHHLRAVHSGSGESEIGIDNPLVIGAVCCLDLT